MSSIKLKHSGGNAVSINPPTSAPTSSEVAFKLPNADGTSGQAIITDASGNLSFATVASGRKYTHGSWVTTSSGTAVTFTGLAAEKELAFDFLNVKCNAGAEFEVQIGDSGGLENSGYQTATGYAGASGNHHDPVSSLWMTEGSGNSAGLRTGRMKLINMYGNWWYMEFDFFDSGSTPHFRFFRGTKELSGQLDRINFTWNGGYSFDGGYIRYVKIEDL